MSLWGVRLMVQDAGLINSLWEFDSLTPYFWPHLLAARKADFQSVNRGSIPRGVIMTEKRQLINGYYAVKYKGDREWALYQESGRQLIKSARTLQELRDFLEIRKLWRG